MTYRQLLAAIEHANQLATEAEDANIDSSQTYVLHKRGFPSYTAEDVDNAEAVVRQKEAALDEEIDWTTL